MALVSSSQSMFKPALVTKNNNNGGGEGGGGGNGTPTTACPPAPSTATSASSADINSDRCSGGSTSSNGRSSCSTSNGSNGGRSNNSSGTPDSGFAAASSTENAAGGWGSITSSTSSGGSSSLSTSCGGLVVSSSLSTTTAQQSGDGLSEAKTQQKYNNIVDDDSNNTNSNPDRQQNSLPQQQQQQHQHQQKPQKPQRQQQQQKSQPQQTSAATLTPAVQPFITSSTIAAAAAAAAEAAVNGLVAGGGGGGIFHSSSTIPLNPTSNNNNDTSNALSEFTPDRPIGYGAFGVVWSVTDPRSGKRVALKKMPNVFQNIASSKRVFREITMLSSFKHDNVLSCLDILQPPNAHFFQELYVLTELMQSDLHKIIVSPQSLTSDHVKVFVYQILRGAKYLHSANILHRDIKPGNLLVNSNCILKICDFGLARVWEAGETGAMTHEVVTQYYRAPELLMGARRYTTAVDVWSIGCIFAELLGRRILFQAQGPIEQLNLIIELLGTPSLSEMKYACEGAKTHVHRAPFRPSNLMKLYSLSPQATHEAVHLLSQMLVFNADKRITMEDALKHSYLDEGRMRFHSCMCTCCYNTVAPAPTSSGGGGQRVFTAQFDSSHSAPFRAKWEREISRLSMFELRDKIYKFVTERNPLYGVPLCINPHSAAFKSFSSSSVAQPSELPPSPLAWDN